MITLDHVQDRAWENKLAKGFNTTDVAADVERLRAEVTEFLIEFQRGDLDEAAFELADVVIFAAGLAEMIGASLDVAVQAKLRINAARTYITDPATGRRSKAS